MARVLVIAVGIAVCLGPPFTLSAPPPDAGTDPPPCAEACIPLRAA